LRRARFQFEIIVVLDYVPDDRTGSIVHRLCETYGEIRLVERLGRRGVGDAIRSGIKLARGDILVPIMGDHSESPLDVVRLIDAIEQGYDIAIGERFKKGRPEGYPFTKYIANRCCNRLIKLLFHIPSSDTTNAFKAYRTRLLSQLGLSSRGFEIFVELPLKVLLKASHAKVIAISIKHSVRKKREAKLSILIDGARYIKTILSIFFRYKVKRFLRRGVSFGECRGTI